MEYTFESERKAYETGKDETIKKSIEWMKKIHYDWYGDNVRVINDNLIEEYIKFINNGIFYER